MNVIKIFKSLFRKREKISEANVEKDTRCDLCKYAYACDKRIEVRNMGDLRKYYIPGSGAFCETMEQIE